jgi:putative membrane protein
MRILIRIFINAVALWFTAWLMTDVDFGGDWQTLLIVAVVFGLVNAFIRPLAKIVTLPINILSLGLCTFVLNGLLLMLTAYITGFVSFGEGGFFSTLWTAILASIVISIVSTILEWVLPIDKKK